MSTGKWIKKSRSNAVQDAYDLRKIASYFEAIDEGREGAPEREAKVQDTLRRIANDLENYGLANQDKTWDIAYEIMTRHLSVELPSAGDLEEVKAKFYIKQHKV